MFVCVAWQSHRAQGVQPGLFICLGQLASQPAGAGARLSHFGPRRVASAGSRGRRKCPRVALLGFPPSHLSPCPHLLRRFSLSLPRSLPALAWPGVDGVVADAPGPCGWGVLPLPSLWRRRRWWCGWYISISPTASSPSQGAGGGRCSACLFFFLYSGSASSSPGPVRWCLFASTFPHCQGDIPFRFLISFW